jgi:hypothetical protein
MLPSSYDIADCKCNSNKYTWSEYVDLLWCSACEKEFTPEHWGFFDGPIAMELMSMFGVCFDRIEIATGKRIKCLLDDKSINEEWIKARP